MTHILEEFKSFLDRSPTSWHAVQEIGNRLAVQDFSPLDEQDPWQLEFGQKYFVIRGGSLCAFCLPKSAPQKAVILASHTDSPALKLKPVPEIQTENMLTLGVEVYGSPLLSAWLNRDLGIAGKVVVSDSAHNLEEKLVLIDDAPLIIPQLAIHLDREVNEKGLILNKQEHLCPLLGLASSTAPGQNYLEQLLRQQLTFESLVSFDLFLYPLEKSRFLGSQNEFIAAYRLDNLASAHACLAALACCAKPQERTLPMCIFWDNEEIGSKTAAGAASPFLNDVLKRIAHSLKLDDERLLILKNKSLCLSVDMAHALNPNYVKMYEPNHKPLLGEGLVIKYNADQRYASNSSSVAMVIQLCRKLGLNYQNYVNRSDLPCGSTVGPIIAHGAGIATADIGCPQLSMHSTREIMACQDYFDLCKLLTHMLQTGL